MGHSLAGGQFNWCSHLCGCGFPWLGNTTRAGSWIALCDRRAVHLGAFRAPSLCCLFCVESRMGSVHHRSPTMAKWRLLVVAPPDLVGCISNRFCTPLTARLAKHRNFTHGACQWESRLQEVVRSFVPEVCNIDQLLEGAAGMLLLLFTKGTRSWVSDCTSFDPHDRFKLRLDSFSESGLLSCQLPDLFILS